MGPSDVRKEKVAPAGMTVPSRREEATLMLLMRSGDDPANLDEPAAMGSLMPSWATFSLETAGRTIVVERATSRLSVAAWAMMARTAAGWSSLRPLLLSRMTVAPLAVQRSWASVAGLSTSA